MDRRFMTEESIMRVEELVLSEKVNSVEDLPKFKNLKKLSLYEVESLETINLGMWPDLEEFSLKLNGYVSRTKHIETGGAPKLKVFDVQYWTGPKPPYDASESFSKLTALDFSKNPELHTLELHGFLNLKTLDFENNRKLSSLKLVNMAVLTSHYVCTFNFRQAMFESFFCYFLVNRETLNFICV
jgi:Leucine-rich repeat (LRR) protein